jgi:hypothetical protein
MDELSNIKIIYPGEFGHDGDSYKMIAKSLYRLHKQVKDLPMVNQNEYQVFFKVKTGQSNENY